MGASILVSNIAKEVSANLSKAGIPLQKILIEQTALNITVTVPQQYETTAKSVITNDWLVKMRSKYGMGLNVSVKTSA